MLLSWEIVREPHAVSLGDREVAASKACSVLHADPAAWCNVRYRVAHVQPKSVSCIIRLPLAIGTTHKPYDGCSNHANDRKRNQVYNQNLLGQL